MVKRKVSPYNSIPVRKKKWTWVTDDKSGRNLWMSELLLISFTLELFSSAENGLQTTRCCLRNSNRSLASSSGHIT